MSPADLLAPGLVLALAIAYSLGTARMRRRGDAWPPRRTLAAAGGLACLIAALAPPVASHDEQFPVHVIQHLLLAMLAPTLLALSAPVTLALRVLARGPRRLLVAVLHSRVARLLVWPPTALALSVAGMYLLYLTPLYALTTRHPLLHDLIHAHMFLAGCLFAWSVAGLDPIPHRPGTRARLLALTTAAAAHNVLAKVLYAHGLPAGAGELTDRHLGAQLLYYGGDLTELILAVAIMAQWYTRTGRRHPRPSRPDVALLRSRPAS